MQIQRDEHGKKGAFFIEEDGEWIAELSYSKSGDNEITIDHTEVDAKLRGKGVGKQLLDEAVKYARDNGFKVKADCNFAKVSLNEDDSFADVLA